MNKRVEYYYLPKNYHRTHDYCEFVIFQIEDFITQKKFDELRVQTIKYSTDVGEKLAAHKGHIFDFLEENGMQEDLNKIVGSNLLNSLIMESCYFLQEGYLCSLKQRLSVAFTLFRKPFFEILIIQLRLLVEDDFLNRFNNEANFNPISLSASEKKEYLEIVNILLNNLYDTTDLYDYLFDKGYDDNIYNIGNTAIHLYTGNNPVIKTEKQNLNFIFSGKKEIQSQWEYIYTIMPMLLTFFADLTELNVLKYTSVSDNVFNKRIADRYRMKKRFRIE
ncbi:MAG: hypothetical protein SGI96_21730 [Bacteroidota bacterium]|nr:hypothetical protein [Bacteroidota bacterium]